MMSYHKYSRGNIFKITDQGFNECYIASRCQPVSNRMADLRSDYKAYKKGKYPFVSVFDLFDKYGVENCTAILIEEHPCDNEEQLLRRQGHHIQAMECVNRHQMGRSDQECREEIVSVS